MMWCLTLFIYHTLKNNFNPRDWIVLVETSKVVYMCLPNKKLPFSFFCNNYFTSILLTPLISAVNCF